MLTLCSYSMKYWLILWISIFFLLKTSKPVFRWIIVQYDQNSILSCPYSYEPNFFFLNIPGRYLLVNLWLMKCLLVFPVLWYFLKLIPHPLALSLLIKCLCWKPMVRGTCFTSRGTQHRTFIKIHDLNYFTYRGPMRITVNASSRAKCPIRSLSSTPWRI